jgi:hypothetical protein
MGHKRVLIAGFLVLTTIAGCINYNLLPKEEQLTGETYLTAPLDNAKMVVETASGNAIETSGRTTAQGRFSDQLLLVSPLSLETIQSFSSYLPLTVKVSGGTCDGEAFDGTLLGYVSSFSPDNYLHVNILTTLIVKYKLAAGVTFEEAETAVKTCLDIPADVDLKNSLNDPNFWNHFDPTRFMALAQANGGFDTFVDLIVANMIDSQNSGFALKAGSKIVSIASKAGGMIMKGIGEGIGKGLTEEAIGWVLGAFGVEDPTEAALNEISDTLDEMNATLTNIESEIATLTNEVSEMMALVQLEWDDLISKYDSLNMSEPENIIQNQYNNMLSTFTTSSDKLCTAEGNALATKFARQILGDYIGTNYDIDQQIYNMYANIVGKAPGSNGALYDLTSELVDRVKAGEDIFDCYLTLENYFGQLAAIQAQGLELMIEAIHMTEKPAGYEGLTSFVGGDTEYYNKFYTQMDEEVEMFLCCVDRLIATKVNVRSEMVQTIAYLPPETAEIYSRADFVAKKLSNTHPAGLIIRLIGDPSYVSDWITNKKIKVAGQDPDVISVNGETINNYAPILPASTPSGVNCYLEWTQNGNVCSFKKQTTVSVVKLHYDVDTAASFATTTPDNTQTLNVEWYDDDFQQAAPADDNIIAYGNGVFYVRVLPTTWRAGTDKETNDDRDMWTSTWSPSHIGVYMYLKSALTDEDLWHSMTVTYTGEFLSTIRNGENDSVTVALKGEGYMDEYNNEWWYGNDPPTVNVAQSIQCNSARQEIQTDGEMTVTTSLSPNTDADIHYQGKMWVDKGYKEYVAKQSEGGNINLYASLSSLEIVPQE